MDDIAISIKNLCKIYPLYKTPQHRLMEALHPFRKKYHHDFHAVNDVTFEVKKGESVGIIGKNGSGKSTLLKIISGVLTPTSGNVQTNGSISSLLELGAGFNPELTGIENIYFNGTIMGYNKEQMDNRLDQILAFADIGEFVHQPVKTYSSGMFVRLAFAVAVCVDPDILIVDEALSVGDMSFQQKCLERLRGLKAKGTTILLVTHDIMLTRNYCEYVVYLKKGKVEIVADAETAGEAYIKDMKNEIQEIVETSKKTVAADGIARFGNNDGEITLVEVTNPARKLPICTEGEPLIITICARVKKTILYPTIYVQIRDFRGYILYGINTFREELEQAEQGTYFQLKAVFNFMSTLHPGEYSVTASVMNAPGETMQTVIDKQVGAATFTVLPKTGQRDYHGVVNLQGTWSKCQCIHEAKHQAF